MNPIFVVALALLFLQPEKRSRGPQPQQNAPSDARGTPQAPLVVQVAPAKGGEAKAREEAEQEAKHTLNEAMIAWGTILLAGITFLLTIGTAFLATYTLNLWRETKRLADDAKDSGEAQAARMEASVQQAVRSADAMEAQVRHAQESSERELRAYISIEPKVVTQDETMDDELFLAFDATVKNAGQTPAYHLRAKSEAKVLRAAFPLDTQVILEPSVGLLAPGAFLKLWTDEECHIDAEYAPVLKRSTDERLYFYGIVTYEDAFRKQWRQRFCYFADWNAVTDKLSLTVAEVWNDEASIGGQPTPKEGGH